VTGRSARGRWERVLAARKQARAALGQDPNANDLYDHPPKPGAKLPEPPAPRVIARHPSERVEYVLSLGEAAARLGMSRAELEAMIAAGKIEALPTGYTRMIPTREIDRLARA
jgi:excisionase family DNA binding protein